MQLRPRRRRRCTRVPRGSSGRRLLPPRRENVRGSRCALAVPLGRDFARARARTMTTFPSTARMPGRSWRPLSRRRSILARRILLLIALTWVPMCLFAIAQGVAIQPSPRGSFLLDFATYARFFVGLPILVVGDAIIRPHLADAAERFVDNGLIRRSDLGAFDEAKARLGRRQASWVAMSVIA